MRIYSIKFLTLDNMRFRAKIIDINCIQHFTRKSLDLLIIFFVTKGFS